MDDLKVGDTLVIHCYKHNGVIYESSRVAYVVDIKDGFINFTGTFTVVVILKISLYKLLKNLKIKLKKYL